MKTTQNARNTQNVPEHFSFLMVPNFALVPYASAIDTLRMANRLSKQKLFTWETLSIDGKPVSAGCGLEVTPNHAAQDNVLLSTLFVCGGISIKQAWSPTLGDWLKRLNKKSVALGSLSTGSYLLARAGLLDGYKCTIHWDNLSAMREEFPQLRLTDCIYEIDRKRYTCAGGTTAIDMMLHLIENIHGRALAVKISDQLLLDRMRCMNDRQRIPLMHDIGTSQPKLTEVVKLMQANVEELLSPDELASFVNISRRQLERLFRTHLKSTPSQFYMNLRLDNARQLLMHTEKSILEVSIACGFASTPYFSKSYRHRFGLPPREDRCQLALLDKVSEKMVL